MKTLPLSFQTAKQLHGLTEILPTRPEWQCCVLSTKVSTKSLVRLFYCDPVKCLEALFNHPLFHDKLDLVPHHVYWTAEHLVCVYTKWMEDVGQSLLSFQYVGNIKRIAQFQIPDGVILSVSSSHPTKQTFLLLLAVDVLTHYCLNWQISACRLVSSCHLMHSFLPLFSQSWSSSTSPGTSVVF